MKISGYSKNISQNKVYINEENKEVCPAITRKPISNNTKMMGNIQSFPLAFKNRINSLINPIRIVDQNLLFHSLNLPFEIPFPSS